jgi:WD40 repeat protein
LELSDRRFDHNDRITAIAVSPNGDWFASSSRDGSLKVWSFPDRVLMQSRRLSSVLQLPEDRVQVLAVSSDGETLVGANSRSLQTWQAKTLQQLNVSPSPLVPAAVSAAGERSLQVSGLSGGEVAVWDLQSWQERRRWTGNRDRVVAMSPDGKTLVTGGQSIGLWDVETGQQRLKIARSLPEDGVVALSPDGRLLAVSAPEDNGVLQLWDARTGGLLHRETASHVSSLTFSADGETLISGDLYGAIAIWHLTHSL